MSSLTVTEGQQAVLEVSRTGGNYGAISVDYATQLGSAISPDDYTAASGTLTWADGETANRTITVDTNDATDDEPLQFFNVVLTNPTGGLSMGRSPS